VKVTIYAFVLSGSQGDRIQPPGCRSADRPACPNGRNPPTSGDGALDLGKLKRASGAQTIDLPGGKDLDGYHARGVVQEGASGRATAEWHPSSGGMMMEHK
jgi:hypothetical protein